MKVLKYFGKLDRKERGFTLIELLIVVAILGILAAVIIPNVGRFLGRGEDEARRAEFHDLSTAVTALTVENDLSDIPNPVSANTAPCTTGTQDMTAFPDTTSDDVNTGKVNDPAGTAYDFDGVGVDDVKGYKMFGHDITADSLITPTVNYINFNSTTYCYTIDANGTVHQYLTGRYRADQLRPESGTAKRGPPETGALYFCAGRSLRTMSTFVEGRVKGTSLKRPAARSATYEVYSLVEVRAWAEIPISSPLMATVESVTPGVRVACSNSITSVTCPHGAVRFLNCCMLVSIWLILARVTLRASTSCSMGLSCASSRTVSSWAVPTRPKRMMSNAIPTMEAATKPPNTGDNPKAVATVGMKLTLKGNTPFSSSAWALRDIPRMAKPRFTAYCSRGRWSGYSSCGANSSMG